jgi:hypothetical protein
VDYVKLTKQVWKAVFGKEPLCEIEEQNPLTIRVDDFTLIQMEGEQLVKTIRGASRQKVMGWNADVFISTYSYDSGPDGDTVELGWQKNFGDALQLAIDANAKNIAENVLQAEYMAEAYEENKKYAEEVKALR